jgi:serine/threonine protein kinase
LGSYEIIRKLARGGMAELFLARTVGPSGFEKVVALKKILPKYAERPRYVSLFCDEARLAASLNHANIVQVYDIGNEGSSYFFAMEYLHGQDVRSILHRAYREREKMPIRFAVQIATQVAAALHYAHELRRPDGSLVDLVHRDVSPSNIIVTYDGAVKLLDFGVAKAATRTVKTRTGTLKGKISYMSPEQAKGAPVDRRSDIFSLGIVLWEMVATSRLFKGENDLATLQLIINVPPRRPSEVRPDCPPELERICLRALSQDITQRYQTADEIVHDLEAFARSADIGPSPTALSVYVSELFLSEINSWQEAKAAGVQLAEHLTHIGDMTEPVMESEFIEAIDLPAMLAREEALDENDNEDIDDLGDDDDDDEEDERETLPPASPARKAGSTPPPTLTAPATSRSSTTAPLRPTPPPLRPTPPPLPPVPAARREIALQPRSATVDGETAPYSAPADLDSVTTPKPPLPLSIVNEPPTAVDLPPTPDEPPAKTAPAPRTPSGGLRAWASGNFPAQDIDPLTVGKWERAGLLVGAVILSVIVVIAVVKQIAS